MPRRARLPCTLPRLVCARVFFTTTSMVSFALIWAGTADAGTIGSFPHEAKEAGRWSLLIASVGLLFVLPFLLWFLEVVVRLCTGNLAGLGAPVVIGWIRGAVIGADKRVSTSKTVAVVWTYAVASALLAIVIAKWWGHPHAYHAQVKVGLQAQYALLIGGPLGAAILAKGIVTSQVSEGQSKQDSTTGAKASDLVSNDEGNTDLGDLQYVLFNTVALVFFFGETLGSPQLGLPTIPDVLLGLTSVSAVGYVGKKALPSVARAITKVDPAKVELRTWRTGAVRLTIFGSGLLNADGSAPDEVRFEKADGSVAAARVLTSTSPEGPVLSIEGVLANTLSAGPYDVVVVTHERNKIAKSGAIEVVSEQAGQ